MSGRVGIAPGIYPGVPMSQYLQLPGVSATHLGWLARSPLHYRHCLQHPPPDTEAMTKGTALHYALLEPDLFPRHFAVEPDVHAIDSPRPRSTKIYRDAVELMRAQGIEVLKGEEMESIHAMVAAIRSHTVAARIIKMFPDREQTVLWEHEDGRLCRGRLDLMSAEIGAIADIKTTRSLDRFSPWVISDLAYHRRMAFYAQGLERLGPVRIEQAYLIAVENTPPHDVGVFLLDPGALAAGAEECERLLERLAECELSEGWPGMFPDLQQGTIVERLMADVHEHGI